MRPKDLTSKVHRDIAYLIKGGIINPLNEEHQTNPAFPIHNKIINGCQTEVFRKLAKVCEAVLIFLKRWQIHFGSGLAEFSKKKKTLAFARDKIPFQQSNSPTASNTFQQVPTPFLPLKYYKSIKYKTVGLLEL